HSRKLFTVEVRMERPPFPLFSTHTSRSGSRKGSGFKSTARTTLNMAVHAPIPSANVRIAKTAKPGVLISARKAYFRSESICGRSQEREFEVLAAKKRK